MSNNIALIRPQKETFFQYIKGENYLRNVTLVSDDGNTVEAHKLVLCASSKFLNELLSDTGGNDNAWIYLSGVEHYVLKDMVEFMYTGEIMTPEVNMSNLLNLANLLAVENLYQLEPKNFKETLEETSNSEEQMDIFSGNLLKREQVLNDPVKNDDVSDLSSFEYDEPNRVKNENMNCKNESSEEEMLTKTDGLWECVKCEKTFVRKDHARTHTQIHSKNSRNYTCNICYRAYGTQDVLRNHKNTAHSTEKFQCPICGKADMSKVQFKNHKYQSKYCKANQ